MYKFMTLLALLPSLSACVALESSTVTADEIAHLSRQHLTYEEVIEKLGRPAVVWEAGDRKYAGYRIDEYESAMSNVDGKGFVPGIGSFAETFKMGSRSVTLEFEKTTGKYLGCRSAPPGQPAMILERGETTAKP